MFKHFAQRCATGFALALFHAILFTGAALAQSFPNKPVKLIIPYPAGAPVDNVARGLGEALSAIWGQPVLIDNRAGANEIVAASAVTKSAPDGYTLLLGTDAAFTQNAYLYNKLPYDAKTELAPVSRVVFVNMVLIARGELPAASSKDFVALMKKEGDKRNYGSAGAGGTTHLAMESFKQEGGFPMQHVPYKGIAPAMQDLLGGNIDALFAGATAAIPHLKTGKVKVLGISGAKRAKSLPDVPTFAEAGYPNTQANFYLGVAAPAGTPVAIINKISADIRKAVADKAFLEKFVDPYGYDPIGETPQQFGEFLKRDSEINDKRIKALGIKLDL